MLTAFGRTLRSYVLSIVLLGALLPLGIIGAWLTRGGVRSGEELLREQLESSLGQVASIAARRWDMRRGDLLFLANNEAALHVLAGNATPADSAFLQQAAGAVDFAIVEFELLDATGLVRWRAHGPSAPVDGVAPDTGSMQAGPGVDVAIPVGPSSSALGTVRARVRLGGILPLDSARLSVPGGRLAVRDSVRGLALVSLTDSTPFPADGKQRVEGADWIAVRRSLPGLPIELALAAPSAPYVAPFEHAAVVGTSALAIVALAALLITTLMTTRLGRSVDALVNAADAVSGGDLSRDVSATGPVEVRRLAGAFNRMTDSLRGVLAELSQRRALAAVGEFAGALSHEVRNALTPVEVDLERAQERSGDDPRTNALISRALSQVRRLEGAVSGALAVARSGFVTRERIDLHDTLRVAMQHAEPVFQEAGSEMILVSAASPIWIDGDANALRQLFVNLLLNAGQASANTGRTTIDTATVADRVTVVIADDGPGIAADRLSLVEQPFFTTRSKGTGLGLPIARQIADAHGGSLEIRSAAGRGTEVRVTLPLAIA
jgi:signal transduction histidine kinase